MRMLVVDDERNVVEFFKQAAQTSGYTVDVALSAEEALTHVIRGTYDLVTLDIQMPGASGLEILSLLRNLCPHAIIAIVSGHVPDALPSNVSEYADVVINKPVDLETLRRLMDAAARVCDTMEEVRLLGNMPVPV